MFLFGMKKKFYYKKLKIMTTDDTKLNFQFKNKKMSFDDKEFRRIILNYRLECKLEKNLHLFICIFKIGSIETIELMFNFDEKI